MIYLYLAGEEMEIISEKNRRFPKILKKIIVLLKKWRGSFLERKIENKNLLILPNLNLKTIKKLKKYLEINCVKNICLSKELLKEKKLKDFIKGQGINILDGRWLFKQIMIKITEYIIQNKKENIESQEISILINEIDDILLENIIELANKVKVINIVTNNENKFKKVEENIYNEKGIILNINNNYKKSLLKSEIIINVDFNEEDINKYDLPKKAIIINLKEEIKINKKSFEGINIWYYDIFMPKKYRKYLSIFKDFDYSMLYESFIYKKTCSINIKKEIEKDGLNIAYLIGMNGKIRKNEYLKCSNNKL